MSLKICHLAASVFLIDQKSEYTITHLAQLLYVIDRESIRLSGYPIVDDDCLYTAMGPCHEKMYSLIIGDASCAGYGWGRFLRETDAGTLVLASSELTLDSLDELSEADIEIVRSVLERGMSESELSFLLDDPQNVPELAGLRGSSHPVEIPLRTILEAVGHSHADEIAADYASLQGALAMLEQAGVQEKESN